MGSRRRQQGEPTPPSPHHKYFGELSHAPLSHSAATTVLWSELKTWKTGFYIALSYYSNIVSSLIGLYGTICIQPVSTINWNLHTISRSGDKSPGNYLCCTQIRPSIILFNRQASLPRPITNAVYIFSSDNLSVIPISPANPLVFVPISGWNLDKKRKGEWTNERTN